MNAVAREALGRLPHGPEFRFLENLIDLVPGKSGKGEYRVKGSEPFLAGHFPGLPLFPGVLLVEAAAQLAGVVAQCDPSIPPLSHLKLTAIRMAKILGTARPGETITLSAQITARMGNLVQADIQAQLGDTIIMSGQIALGGIAA